MKEAEARGKSGFEHTGKVAERMVQIHMNTVVEAPMRGLVKSLDMVTGGNFEGNTSKQKDATVKDFERAGAKWAWS